MSHYTSVAYGIAMEEVMTMDHHRRVTLIASGHTHHLTDTEVRLLHEWCGDYLKRQTTSRVESLPQAVEPGQGILSPEQSPRQMSIATPPKVEVKFQESTRPPAPTTDDLTTPVGRRVVDIICDMLDVVRGHIEARSHIIDDLGADSLCIVELTLAAEEAWEMDIPDEDIEQLHTVGQAVAYIQGRVDQKAKG